MKEIMSNRKFKKVEQAKVLAKFFSIDLVIKVFGITIIEYHFPPQNDSLGTN